MPAPIQVSYHRRFRPHYPATVGGRVLVLVLVSLGLWSLGWLL